MFFCIDCKNKFDILTKILPDLYEGKCQICEKEKTICFKNDFVDEGKIIQKFKEEYK
jgi:hypothetical protein